MSKFYKRPASQKHFLEERSLRESQKRIKRISGRRHKKNVPRKKQREKKRAYRKCCNRSAVNNI